MDLREACRPHGPQFPGAQNHGFGLTPSDQARWCPPESEGMPQTPAKGQFVPIAVGSLNGDMVVRAAFGSYVDPAYQRQWVVENIASIRNQHLDKEYRARSQEMLLQRNQFRSRMAPANDSLMFSCVRTDEELQKIADDGYVVRSTSSNYLGDGMKGVTLSCHADVHLKVAQLVVTHTCWMIISKVVLGNRRMVTEVREGAVDVTPDYDSHLFAVGPNISQTLSEQAIRNQAFFFEFDNSGNTSSRPRQILPFHAIKFRNVDSFSLRLTAGDSLREPLPLAVVQPTQATQQNRETSNAIPSTTPAPDPNSADQGGAPTTRLPFQHAALARIRANESQQNSVSVMLGLQSLLNHMTVESGLGNRPIQTAVLSGIQNQLNSLAVQSGLQNHQNYLALLSGLQNQVTGLFIQSGLQSQNASQLESAAESRVSGKEPTDARGSYTAHGDQCTPSPQSGDVNHDTGLTIRPCNDLSVFELPCSGFAPQTDTSHDRSIATPSEAASSYPEFGMRLSIVAPPGATDGEPVESGPECFQPIVIKPETAPSFLLSPVVHEQQDSASVCTQEVEPANAPSCLWAPPAYEQQESVRRREVETANMPGFPRAPPAYEQQDSTSVRTREFIPVNAPGFLWSPPADARHPCPRTQNPLLLNLIHGRKDAKRVPEPHLRKPLSALFRLLNGDTSVDQTAASCSETFAESPVTTSADLSDVVLGTVSEVVPNGSPQARVTQTFDEVLDGLLKDVAALSSACCDISSGMKRKSLPLPVEVAATEGSTANAGHDTEGQSQDVARLYIHDDGSLELVIEQLVSDDEGSITDDDSATNVDPIECSFESYEDRVNWRRFLTDKRFQPTVMLERLNI